MPYTYSWSDGPTNLVMNLGSLKDKFEAFGWQVLEMDGNDLADIFKVMAEAKAVAGKGKPTCILMHTIMGKGVGFMEGTHEWHGSAPSDKQLEEALNQLPVTSFGDY